MFSFLSFRGRSRGGNSLSLSFSLFFPSLSFSLYFLPLGPTHTTTTKKQDDLHGDHRQAHGSRDDAALLFQPRRRGDDFSSSLESPTLFPKKCEELSPLLPLREAPRCRCPQRGHPRRFAEPREGAAAAGESFPRRRRRFRSGVGDLPAAATGEGFSCPSRPPLPPPTGVSLPEAVEEKKTTSPTRSRSPKGTSPPRWPPNSLLLSAAAKEEEETAAASRSFHRRLPLRLSTRSSLRAAPAKSAPSLASERRTRTGEFERGGG